MDLGTVGGANHGGELIRFQTRPADKTAVDVRLGKEFGRIGRLDASPVKDTHTVREFG